MIFDYLNTITINDGLWRGTNKDFISYPLVWATLSLGGVLWSPLPDRHCQDLLAAKGS
jgi:hypothetical protein